MPLLTVSELRDSLRVTHADSLLAAVLGQAEDAVVRQHGELHPVGTRMTCTYALPGRGIDWPVYSLALPRPVAGVTAVMPAPALGYRLSGRELLAQGGDAWYGRIVVTALLTDERPAWLLAELELARARLTGEGNPDEIIARLFPDATGWGRFPDLVAYDNAQAVAYAIGVGDPPDGEPVAVSANPRLTIPAFSGAQFIWIYSAQPVGRLMLSGFDQTAAFRRQGNYLISRARWDGALSGGGVIEVVPA